jgi:hypothetical protein
MNDLKIVVFVGQVGNLPVAELYRNFQRADLQSAAGYQPAPHF